jgi:hypothetical protein
MLILNLPSLEHRNGKRRWEDRVWLETRRPPLLSLRLRANQPCDRLPNRLRKRAPRVDHLDQFSRVFYIRSGLCALSMRCQAPATTV